MKRFPATSLALGLCALAAVCASATAQSILILNGTGTSSVASPLIAAGFNVVSGTLDPGQISSNLALDPSIVEIWIWNDGTFGGGGSPADPTRDFDAGDLAALDLFSATHPHWIMDSYAWRTHTNADELNLTMNEALGLAAGGGGIVLGTKEASGGALVQHVNQIAAHVGFNPFVGVYSTTVLYPDGILFNSPVVVDPNNILFSFYTYCDVPNGYQPNGLVLNTALFAAPSGIYPPYPASPDLANEVFGGILYPGVDHLITTTLPAGGLEAIQAFCFPGNYGVMACPCSNAPGTSGVGCDNSAGTGGAQLLADGSIHVSSDTVQFTSSGEKPSATSIFLQGTLSNGGGVPFGQAVRCTAGVLKRLYVKSASSGVAIAPDVGDPSVTARSAFLGDTIIAGETRYYQTYYRDPTVLGGCPNASTFNATQGLAITWLP